MQVIKLLKVVLQIIQILVPIGLILMGSIDLGRAVIAQNEDGIKKGQKSFIRRCLSAAIVFLVVLIVTLAMNFVGNNTWKECWNNEDTTIPNESQP
jgi:hypothetical protein